VVKGKLPLGRVTGVDNPQDGMAEAGDHLAGV
jgi:hypothetical protein